MATITVGTNSWVTIAEADTYNDEQWNRSAWSGLTAAQKTQLLITAYRWINADDRYDIPATSTDDNVKYAQIETAWYIYSYYTQIDKRMALQQQGVKSFDVSKFSETYTMIGKRLPDFVDGLLEDYKDYLVAVDIERELD